MYGSVEQAFVGRDEPKNGCEGGYAKRHISHFREITRRFESALDDSIPPAMASYSCYR